ncbi:MAG: NAD(P)H-dependent oxidoreductase [Pseudomonadota bacterium]
MKHAIIFAHPRDHSFTGSVAESYARAAGGLGHSVLTRDLYRMKFNPCLGARELPFAEDFQPGEDVQAERRLLADADVFALIYPFWLNSPPAMLKGYLERVFGFGFAYGKSGRSEPLLHGRSLITFSASGAPLHWVQETGALETTGELFDKYFAEVCGLTFLEHVHFGGIVPGIREDVVANRLAQVESTVVKHFGRAK